MKKLMRKTKVKFPKIKKIKATKRKPKKLVVVKRKT